MNVYVTVGFWVFLSPVFNIDYTDPIHIIFFVLNHSLPMAITLIDTIFNNVFYQLPTNLLYTLIISILYIPINYLGSLIIQGPVYPGWDFNDLKII